MKKIMALTLMLMMLMSTMCLAAVSSSGSKSSSTPSSSSKPSTSAPSSSQTAPAGSGTYKPSAPANSYSNTAPAKQTTPSTQQNTQPQSSFWRNASMIGGGMLAGSLLGHLFGNSNMGGESSIFGMLINLLMIGGIVVGVRYLWNKYKNKNRNM